MEAKDFIRAHIVSDLDSGKHSTVFRQNLNGYLHIGHAKSRLEAVPAG